MKRACLAGLATVLLIGAGAPARTSGPVVRAPAGALAGGSDGAVERFLGIPFAAAPMGELRWRAPQPLPPWSGLRPAAAFGASCPQPLVAPTQLAPLGPTSEDCLFLNVWRPKHARGSRLPVLVWIHGGGFVAGSGSEAVYDGTQFAQRGVVLVTINYRLGRLGFLAHPALGAAHPEEPTGNFGYLDQLAALRWVRGNIAAFGGDPRNVTVAGESAGALSVMALMASPMAEGLIDKAIVQSGAAFDAPRPLAVDTPVRESARSVALRWARGLKIEGEGEAAARALRALPVDAIAPPAPALAEILGILRDGGPILDGRYLTEPAGAVIRAGRAKPIPLIVGNTSLEGSAWLFGPETLGLVPIVPPESEEQVLCGFAPAEREAIVARYLGLARNDRDLALAMLSTARGHGLASLALAAAASRRAPAFVYRFEASPAPGRAVTDGAPHGTDVFYVFETLDRFRHRPDLVTDADRAVAATVADYWASFARDGVPRSARGPRWQRYREATANLLVVTDTGAANVRAADLDLLPRGARCREARIGKGLRPLPTRQAQARSARAIRQAP